MNGQSFGELIEDVRYDFSASRISEFLVEIGLSVEAQSYEEESFESLIFLRGDDEEVYGKSERHFIESIEKAIVFAEFFKETHRGNMPCRFLAFDLSDFEDAIYASVFLMKIVNKALSGFNIFIIKTASDLHIGMKLFDKDEGRNCTLSEPGMLSVLLDEFWYDGGDDFLDFYNVLVSTFQPKEIGTPDYDELICRKKGVKRDYIDVLIDIENLYGESAQSEIDRYCAFFEEDIREQEFAATLNAYVEDLKDVKSSKVNTIEMLFEADEIERLAIEVEKKQEVALQEEDKSEHVDTEIVEQFRDDPEAMIKLLKKKKGLL